MVTDITGSYYGGRRPLTFGMRAGQFRNSRASIFPSQTIINNNIGFGGGCYNYDYCDCGNSNKMSWMDWTMFGGVMLNGIGNFLSCFWGGGGGGSNGVEEKPVDLNTIKSDAAAVAKAYTNKKPTVTSDGTIRIKINGKVEKFDNVDDMEAALQEAQGGTTTTTVNPGTTPATGAPAATISAAPAQPVAPTPQPRTDGLGTGWNNIQFTGDNALKITNLSDPLAENVDFTGATITYSADKGTNVNLPKTITITKDRKEYVFQLCDQKNMNIDGNPRYKCIKSAGDDLGSNGMQQEYMLTPEGKLVQNESTRGTGYNTGENYNTFINQINTNKYKQEKYNSNSHGTYSINEGMTAEDVLKACLGADAYNALSNNDKTELQSQLCKLNPNGMQGGVVRNLDKLNLILPKTP